jgi:hypothetical protein
MEEYIWDNLLCCQRSWGISWQIMIAYYTIRNRSYPSLVTSADLPFSHHTEIGYRNQLKSVILPTWLRNSIPSLPSSIVALKAFSSFQDYWRLQDCISDSMSSTNCWRHRPCSNLLEKIACHHWEGTDRLVAHFSTVTWEKYVNFWKTSRTFSHVEGNRYRKHFSVPVLTLTSLDDANFLLFPPLEGLLRCADCGHDLYWI